MSRTHQAHIEIAAPVPVVFERLAAFEHYPAFVPGLVAVRRISPRRLRVEADVGGTEHRWPVRIVEQRRDSAITLAHDERFSARARARLRPLGEDRTAVAVELEYALDMLRERLLGLLFDPQPQLEAGLALFRDWVQEDGSVATSRRRAAG